MKRQLNQLAYYSEGNIPESLIGVPDAWTPDQIKNFQDYWDLYFTGDLARRRRAKFVPGGVAKTFIQTKEPELKNAFDEWIARVVCFAFSVSPQPLVNQMNRATSETQKDSADEEGLLPILGWIKRLCDHVIHMLGADTMEFVWRPESVIDPTIQRANLVAYVSAGMMTRQRAAAILGETLPDDPMADVLTVTTAQGVVRLGGNPVASGDEAAPERLARGELSFDLLKRQEVSPAGWELASAELNKYNNNHDERGRFAAAGSASRQVVAVNVGVGGDGGKDDFPEEELSERMHGVGPTGHANHGRTLTPDVRAVGAFGAPASSFNGSSRFQMQSPAGVPPRNDPATIDGVPYSGHALDEMQNRGLFPSVTGQVIRDGLQGSGNRSDTSVFYDPTNNVSVIRNDITGNVITVISGDRRKEPK